MPRRLRIFVPGGIYHVYCRVARGERVFAHQSEVDRWVDAVAFVSRLHDLSILSWCLMSNHYHLVVRTGTMPLWRAMARLQGRVPWWRTVKDDDETVPRDQAPDSSLDYAGQPLAPENHRRPPLKLILRTFEIEVGLAKGQLAGRARTRYLSWCRCLFVTFAVSWLGFPAKEVAQLLDKASGSVSRWLSEGLELQQTEPSFRSTLDLLAGPYNLEAG